MPKSSQSKCGEFQDGNIKPLITKSMKNEGTWTFFYAAVVAAVASTPKYVVRYTRTQQRKIVRSVLSL